MTAPSQRGERKLSPPSRCTPKAGLDGLARYKRNWNTAAPSLTIKRGGKIIGQTYGCASHICILAYATELLNHPRRAWYPC